jgi:FkbM family methyltransferase
MQPDSSSPGMYQPTEPSRAGLACGSRIDFDEGVATVQTSELYHLLEQQYFGENMHEKDEIEHLPELLKGVSVFVDVGASLGQYTYFANQILKNGTIYCIEADPIRIHRLKELASQWENTSNNRIFIIHAAAVEAIGRVEFFRTDANLSGGLFVRAPADHARSEPLNWTACDTEGITLDSLCGGLEPDLIKIDVEGSEYRVLAGARNILAAGKCRFLVEVHPWGDESLKKTPSDVFRFFSSFGYGFKRTHRHWLFQKSDSSVRRFVKGKLILFILQSRWLKTVAKRCALTMHVLSKRKPGSHPSPAATHISRP